MFSWGYWGWGNATPHLLTAVDAAERESGFEPPVFVDIRYRRSVRAKGFSGRAFEELLTPSRYRWMQRLGNEKIATHESGVRIVDPTAAKDLLDLGIELGSEQRRALFFCACEFPNGCHRNPVAAMLLNEAENVGVNLEVVEWPGGSPSHCTLDVGFLHYKAVLRGRQSVPLEGNCRLSEMRCLPWGSIVTLRANGETVPILTGPAKYQKGWVLPVFECGKPGAEGGSLDASSKRFRTEHGLEPYVTGRAGE